MDAEAVDSQQTEAANTTTNTSISTQVSAIAAGPNSSKDSTPASLPELTRPEPPAMSSIESRVDASPARTSNPMSDVPPTPAPTSRTATASTSDISARQRLNLALSIRDVEKRDRELREVAIFAVSQPEYTIAIKAGVASAAHRDVTLQFVSFCAARRSDREFADLAMNQMGEGKTLDDTRIGRLAIQRGEVVESPDGFPNC